MTLKAVSLDDKYSADSGRIYLTGIQALVRLPLLQAARDRAAGLNTGGFISGYRGSPLGGYDIALERARGLLEASNIRFQPGVNEDLAATALWGTQQTTLFPGAQVDGVFGIWYGKGPGVDRSTDALKHANLAGTFRHGGVLAIAGDDHISQSSSAAHQSELVFAAAMIPVLNPASLQDYFEFGLFGFALSRFSGCWVGFKAVAQTVETSGSILIDPTRPQFVIPPDYEAPPGGLGIRWPDWPLDQEKRLHGPKMAAVAAFARANPIDRIVWDPARARLAIFATGKGYSDLREALAILGIDARQADALGIRLYKIGLTWPMEKTQARSAADNVQEVLVVEEKRALVEDQLRSLLYHVDASRRPRVVGKHDETGQPLFQSEGEFDPLKIARVLIARLALLSVDVEPMRQKLGRLEADIIDAPVLKTPRMAFFCSGCPHNTSTRLPEGSRATAGIGCHGMLTWMPYRNTSMITHMGGEGMMWVGQSPFTTEPHVFQNLGDGTYTHSGLLAIRAAAAAGVNITYKILYNDAVAMTGGQALEGQPTVPQISRQVAAEGARKVVVVADDPDKYPADADFARGVTVRHRDQLDLVQRELRETPGLTVLIYDQVCAAEKRRRRKRGRFPDPPKRVFINDAVCEGCGDCSEQSHCISVVPLETEFGRKRAIDQSSCNKDYSCVNGFCPSFVTVHGGQPRRAKPATAAGDELLRDIPEPKAVALAKPCSIVVAGIGGTGVITVGALLGMAAHLEGKACLVLDSTGLAQKNGAVLSHVRLAPRPDDLHSGAVPPGSADLLLACDMIVAASPAALSRVSRGVTRVVADNDLTPTAAFVANGDIDFEAAAIEKTLTDSVGTGRSEFIAAKRLGTALAGDAATANLLMVGYALQRGWLPLGVAAIERAIELNQVAVEQNKRAVAYGRLLAHDPDRLSKMLQPVRSQLPQALDLDSLVERRAQFLSAYQDDAYAARYRARIAEIATAERKVMGRSAGLAEAAARSLFKLMAYKDEYEVARLYTDGDFMQKLNAQFEGDFRLQFHLAPPGLTGRDPATGNPRKRAYGRWIFPAFRLLAQMRFLRGTAFDPFGRTAERRMERQLIADYEATLRDIAGRLSPADHGLALQIAQVPLDMRGFGHVKSANVEKAKRREAELLNDFHAMCGVP